MSINWPRIIAFISAIIISSSAVSAEDLYTNQPPVTPELAFAGPYDVGVSTISAIDHGRLNTTNFITTTERPLVLEVWYPADLSAPSASKATYKNVTRLQQPFELQGDAYRNAAAVSNGQFPIVLLSHGFTGYRTQMFYLGEHLASHGYVVVGIDHKDSTNAEVFDNDTRASGGISTFYNRARDQQFVLDYFAEP